MWGNVNSQREAISSPPKSRIRLGEGTAMGVSFPPMGRLRSSHGVPFPPAGRVRQGLGAGNPSCPWGSFLRGPCPPARCPSCLQGACCKPPPPPHPKQRRQPPGGGGSHGLGRRGAAPRCRVGLDGRGVPAGVPHGGFGSW